MRKLSVKTTFHERLWGWIYLALQVFVLPILLAIANMMLNLRLSAAELNFVFFALNFTVVTLIFHRFILENGKIALQAPISLLLNAFIGFIVYMILSNAVSGIITAVSPEHYNVNDSYISTMVADAYVLMIIGTVFLVPITEELLYRGLIFAGIYNRSRILAYIVSTVAFAALHVYSYIGTYSTQQLLLCLLEYVPAGICLGWAYAKTDSIWTPILIHMSVNAIAVSAMR